MNEVPTSMLSALNGDTSKGSSVITDIFLETKTGCFSSTSLPPP